MLGHLGGNICGNDTNVTATITGNNAKSIKCCLIKCSVYGNVCINYENKKFH